MGLTAAERDMLKSVQELALMRHQMKDRAEGLLKLQQQIRRMEKRVAASKERCAAGGVR